MSLAVFLNGGWPSAAGRQQELRDQRGQGDLHRRTGEEQWQHHKQPAPDGHGRCIPKPADRNRDGYFGAETHQSQAKAGYLFAEDHGQGKGEQDGGPLKDPVWQDAQEDDAGRQVQQQIFEGGDDPAHCDRGGKHGPPKKWDQAKRHREGGCFEVFTEDKEKDTGISVFCAGSIVRISVAAFCVESMEHRHFHQEQNRKGNNRPVRFEKAPYLSILSD